MKDGIKIQHGVYNHIGDCFTRYSFLHKKFVRIDIPKPFHDYLLTLYLARPMGPVEFTYGVDEENDIHALAVVHENDNFNRKIGNAIVRGRIKRQRGDLGRSKYIDKPWICGDKND